MVLPLLLPVVLSAEASALDPNLPSEHALRVSCYCEENVWRLAYRRLNASLNQAKEKAPTTAEVRKYHVAFISNKDKCCPLFYQKASKDSSSPCFWDYHVILLETTFSRKTSNNSSKLQDNDANNNIAEEATTNVLDLDSRLPYPCPIALYLNETFHPTLSKTSTDFAPLFRVLPAATFLEHFYSDRMHMFDRKNQTWSSPPPNYECILNGRQENEISTSNLGNYINMTQQPQATIYGRVLTLDEMKTQAFTEI